MSEQEQNSQLSALFDGELPAQQAQMVIRRALKDPATRTTWERYALIGACLRSEPISAGTSVADRVQARLAGERELDVTPLDLNVTPLPAGAQRAPAPRAARFPMLGRGALGGAIAAGVALVAIVVVRNVAPTSADTGVLVAQAGAADVQAVAEVGYTTPGENSPAQRRMVDASLGYYLVAHSEEAASAFRSSYDLVQGGVELTEDEISAWR